MIFRKFIYSTRGINSQEVPDEIDSQMADVIEAAIPFNQ